MRIGLVSTHDLTKRSTAVSRRWAAQMEFQLTTSRRGRLGAMILTGGALVFQLTTSRRGRRTCRNTALYLGCFNSRPHEEVDIYAQIRETRAHFVSTHDLTKRSTFFNASNWLSTDVSTHDLTKRSTSQIYFCFQHNSVSTHDLTKRSTLPEPPTA